MEERVTQLRYKEVIDISSGVRFGYVGDIEVDWREGKVCSLVVPGRLRWFGLLGREEDFVVPFEAVKRLGEDIILVDSSRIGVGRKGGREKRRQNSGF